MYVITIAVDNRDVVLILNASNHESSCLIECSEVSRHDDRQFHKICIHTLSEYLFFHFLNNVFFFLFFAGEYAKYSVSQINDIPHW